MFTGKDIQERYHIIKTADQEDVLILDENYTRMIKESINDDEREQLKKLKIMIRTRINGNEH